MAETMVTTQGSHIYIGVTKFSFQLPASFKYFTDTNTSTKTKKFTTHRTLPLTGFLILSTVP